MKRVLCTLLVLFCVSAVFGKTYSEYLAEAKKYEEQKKWCYALGSYYDAMGTDELPENKIEAYEGYKKLKDAIISGNPGLGKYNQFTIHDEWEKLLIDAEKYGSSISIYDITVGELEQGDLDYKTKTATYTAKVSYTLGDRYDKTILNIERGYRNAYKKDWTDLPIEWPLFSVSSKHDKNYNINGALVYSRMKTGLFVEPTTYYINAFYQLEGKNLFSKKTAGLYDYKFNIVDKKGKELVKGKRWLLGDGDKVSISGITPDVMDLIDNGEAFINPVGCYLQYGEYSETDDKGGRTFMKNFPEVQLSTDKMVFICWNNETDKISKNVLSVMLNNLELVNIPGLQIQMLKTEVTQTLYKGVIGQNPSKYIGGEFPVEQVSWYDSIYFCNKLSELKGYKPVYSVNGNINTIDWNYIPHKKNSINGTIAQSESADGFRLPTIEEWEYASKGGEKYRYSGSDNRDEVSWYGYNSGEQSKPVAKKKPNGYGLYDMTGNVWEWCWDSSGVNRLARGDGFWIGSSWQEGCNPSDTHSDLGIRIVCSTPEQIVEKQRLLEERKRQEEITRQEQIARKEEEQRIKEEKRVAIADILNNIGLITLEDAEIEMLKTEVTQTLYEAVMGENPSTNKGENLPVGCVFWYDAIYFCNKLSEINGLTPVYSVNGSCNISDWNYIPHKKNTITVKQNESADGFRLPTVKEWEYAAKGGQSFNYAGSDSLDEVGWYSNNSGKKTHPVALKKANGYGFYDMTGNVSEWCWGANSSHPKCGGNWNSYAYDCRIDYRETEYFNERYSYLGFRIVRSISE